MIKGRRRARMEEGGKDGDIEKEVVNDVYEGVRCVKTTQSQRSRVKSIRQVKKRV